MAAKIQINYITKFQFCDRNHFTVVKGISAVMGLASLVYSMVFQSTALNFLYHIALSVFLLCSGYGVSESYDKKGGLPHFWENKFVKIWLPSFLVLVIYSLAVTANLTAWITSYPLALKGDLLYLIFGNYLAFWLLVSFFDNQKVLIWGLWIFAVIAFCFAGNSSLFAQVFCFPLGVTVSQLKWRRAVRGFGGKEMAITLCISVLTAVASCILSSLVRIPYVTNFLYGLFYCSSAVCLILGVYAAQRIPVFGVFAPFGYMAYMLYLVASFVLPILKRFGDWRIMAGGIGVMLVVCMIASWLINRLVDLNKNIRRRGKTRIKGSMW